MEGKILSPKGIARQTLERSKWHKHRSTWMMVSLLLSLIMLILAATVATPVIEVLLIVFTVLIWIPKIASYMIAAWDGAWNIGSWIKAGENPFHRFKTWLAKHPDQAIIAGAGIVLTLVGLGLMIGFAPVMASVLTLACGCSIAYLVSDFVLYGPITIADAVNNYLDRSEAEKILEDGEEYELRPMVNSKKPGQSDYFSLLETEVDPDPEDSLGTTVTKKNQ